MNPFDDVNVSNDRDVSKAQSLARPKPNQTRKRKPPKSAVEQLAEFEAKAASLRKILDEQRVKFRDEFMEDLYRKCGIGPVEGDPNESERLRQLRKTLQM